MIETKLQELLDKEINLAQGRVSQGSTSHTYIRTLLANRRTTDPSFPWILDGDFLSGSYARGTKLHPLDARCRRLHPRCDVVRCVHWPRRPFAHLCRDGGTG